MKATAGAGALVWLKINPDGTYDCSAKKFFGDEDYVKWVEPLGWQKDIRYVFLAVRIWSSRSLTAQLYRSR